MTSRTVLHAGAHKTATTLIQNCLLFNEKILNEHGIFASLPHHIQGTAFERFFYERSKPRRFTVSSEEVRNFILERERIYSHCHTHIVSKENLLGEAGRLYLNSGNVAGLILDLFSHSRLSIVFYVRRMDEFIESHVLQQLAHGKTISCDGVINSIGSRTWIDVIDSIEKQFGGSISVRFYESIFEGAAKFVSDFFEHSSIDIRDQHIMKIPSIVDQNRTISDAGLNILMKFWPELDIENRVQLFEDIRRRHNTSTEPKPTILTREQRQHILLSNRDSHRALIERYSMGNQNIRDFYLESTEY